MTPNSPPSLGKRKKIMHDMHKLDVDMKFTQMTAKRGTVKHVYIAVASIYK